MKKNESVSLSSGWTSAGTRFKMSYETHHVNNRVYIINSEMQNIFEVQPPADSSLDNCAVADEDLLLN